MTLHSIKPSPRPEVSFYSMLGTVNPSVCIATHRSDAHDGTAAQSITAIEEFLEAKSLQEHKVKAVPASKLGML